MKEPARDPRTDPKPGDCLRGKTASGKPRVLKIDFVENDQVYYRVAEDWDKPIIKACRMPFNDFVKQAAAAEIA